IERQIRRYLHVMVYGEYVLEPQAKYAGMLAQLLPDGLNRVYFTNSGAEAIEGALKTARKHTGRDAFVAFQGAYHGDTMGALALAGNAAFRSPFGPLPGPVIHLPYGDATALGAIDERVAGVIVEPVQAEGGVRIPTESFIKVLRRRCSDTGALLLFDEVLTGFGRTGRLFAMEHFGVAPDLIVLAKTLGGGLPLGAFCGSDEVMGVLSKNPPLGHITTFGGHPLSCAAGMAAAGIIVGDRMWERAEKMGTILLDRLSRLGGPEIVDVRGIGLLAGIEFAEAETAHRFVAATIERGVVVNWTLNADRVVRLAPPLTISVEEIDFAAAAMGAALESIRR
ncbi:MAG TPA: aspartate aminotransferase family protein, partial [Candidatus Binataceae bacterium]|nr:aspartate aminotransferase family protein [Candidatus Binataceae bacterium]